MIIIREKKEKAPLKVLYREGLINFRESKNLPAIAQAVGISTNPKITTVVRQDTIYSTIQAMGLPVKINAMKNVVATVKDMQEAGAVMATIYAQFGVKASLTITWDGQGKCYWDPRTPVDQPQALAYANAAGLPPPNPRKYLA